MRKQTVNRMICLRGHPRCIYLHFKAQQRSGRNDDDGAFAGLENNTLYSFDSSLYDTWLKRLFSTPVQTFRARLQMQLAAMLFSIFVVKREAGRMMDPASQ